MITDNTSSPLDIEEIAERFNSHPPAEIPMFDNAPTVLGQKDIDLIVDGVYKKLQPEFELAYNAQKRGMLVGMHDIGSYMAVKSLRYGTKPLSQQCLRRWHSKLGLPLCKSPLNTWWTTKALIDQWVYKRGMLMRKLNELGYKVLSGCGTDGYVGDAPPERYKPHEREHAMREMAKDRVRGSIGEE